MAKRSRKKDYALGVLLIHGIGRSRQGDTLVRFGEAIANWLDEWIPKGTQSDPNSPLPSRDPRHASIGNVHLRGQLEDPSAPAHVEVNVANATKSRTGKRGPSRWLLAESWWSETFPTPKYADIASWALEVLPWTVISHFDRRMRRAGFHVRNAYSLWQWIIQVFHWLLNVFWLLVALFIVPVVVLFVFALLIVGLFPIPAVRSFVAKMQRGLATTIGDSFVLLGSPFAGAAIVSKVRRDLEWIAKRCDSVAVVAHSQGAAIAHKVIHPDLKTPCKLLITFGSGLKKLSEVERAMKRGGSGVLWFATISMLFAAGTLWLLYWGLLQNASKTFVIAALIMMSGGMLYGVWWQLTQYIPKRTPRTAATRTLDIFVPTICILAYLTWSGWIPSLFSPGKVEWRILLAMMDWLAITPAFLLSSASTLFALLLLVAKLALNKWQSQAWRTSLHDEQVIRDNEIFDRLFKLRRTTTRWVDMYASADPVPNGPLLDLLSPSEGLVSVEVYNRGSLFSDHVTYWKNREEFVAAVAAELAATAGGLQVDDNITDRQRLYLARRRRRGRVLWLTVARRTLAALGLLIALGWEHKPPDFLTALAGTVRETVKEIPLLGTLLGKVDETPVNILSVILVLVFVYYVLYLVWVWWERADFQRLITRDYYRLIEIPFAAFIVLFACVVVLPGMFVLTEWLGQDYFYAFVIAGGLITLVLASDHFFNTQMTERLIISSAAGPIEEAFKRAEDFEKAELERGIDDRSLLAAYRLARRMESEGKGAEANRLYEKIAEFNSRGRD